MTENELGDIENLVRLCRLGTNAFAIDCFIRDDAPKLIAEIRRLQAEAVVLKMEYEDDGR